MKKTLLALALLSVFLPLSCLAQDSTSVNQARKDNLINMLNYRFKGGYYSFEKIFNQKVSYPEMAKSNCILGITILSLTVDCDGTISDLKIKNPLGYGVDDMISNFVTETNGLWNKCTDIRYTKLEIPIQFRTEGTKTADDVALFVCVGDNPGFVCNDDEYYLKKAKRFLEKGRGKKALEVLAILTKRDPYNSMYYEMKMEAINM